MKFLKGLFLITLFTSCTSDFDVDIPNGVNEYEIHKHGHSVEFNEKSPANPSTKAPAT